MKYLFGPVPSRRFGRSLGVDLTPYKTCCFDCVFCQLGRTTHKTVDRREYAPVQDVLSELDRWIAGGGRAGVITLSGSGEPTLHSRFGEVIDSKTQVNTEALLSMLRRRPCTSEQIAKGFGMHANEVSKYLGSLLRTGRIRAIRKNGSVYYATKRLEDKRSSINVF